jgi:hypothetical protein
MFFTNKTSVAANTVIVSQASNTVINTGIVSGGININNYNKKD